MVDSNKLQRILQSLDNSHTLVKNNDQTVTLHLSCKTKLPRLPEGYFFKGGAARELLRHILHPAQLRLPIRDYDIARYAETSDAHDHEIANRLMTDDYEFGHGVEVVEDRSTYFATRDLTFNEVLCFGRTVECSIRCIIDLFEGTIRATPYVTDACDIIESRTVTKMIRLAAEATITNIPFNVDLGTTTTPIHPFDVALHLDRAMLHNTAIAEEYLHLCWRHQMYFHDLELPPTLSDAIRAISGEIRQGLSFFKNIPLEVLYELK